MIIQDNHAGDDEHATDADLLARALDLSPAEAREILCDAGGLRGIAGGGLGALVAGGASYKAAARYFAAYELALRVHSAPMPRGAVFANSRDIVRAYGPRLRALTEERFVVVALDSQMRPMAEQTMAWGSVGECAVSLRAVVTFALRQGAAALVAVHNHPSGDPAPSPEDLSFTRGLKAALDLVGVTLCDHIILAAEGSFAFADAGLLAKASKA